MRSNWEIWHDARCPDEGSVHVKLPRKAKRGLVPLRLRHVSLTARNADQLSSFYKQVFGFVEKRAPKRLSGKAVFRGNGLPDNDIYAIWLTFPNTQDPFLEIMEYTHPAKRGVPAVNDPGFGHIAFEVCNLHQTLENVLRFGGSLQAMSRILSLTSSPIGSFMPVIQKAISWSWSSHRASETAIDCDVTDSPFVPIGGAL